MTTVPETVQAPSAPTVPVPAVTAPPAAAPPAATVPAATAPPAARPAPARAPAPPRKKAGPRIGIGAKDVTAARESAALTYAARLERLAAEAAEAAELEAQREAARARGELVDEPDEPEEEAEPAPSRVALRPETLGKPTIIVENLHVVYRVLVTGKRANNKSNRLLQRDVTSRGIREIHAVNGISFVAHEGEAIGLIGVNGSGKSTLLRAIAGLQPSAAGRVWADADPTLLGVNTSLFPELSGERNIIIGGLAMGMSPEEIAERAPEIAEFAAIGEFIDLPMMTYSSGMGSRLRFAIASATVHRILLIDEALATGDSAFQRRSEARINELRDSAGTVFVVSHSDSVIRTTCNRTIWLHKGEMIMDGLTDEVLEAYDEFSQGRR